jgi:VanZ family protein
VATAYKNLLFYWLPLFIYCLLIYIQSAYPSFEHSSNVLFLDKFLHLLAYAALGVLFFRAYRTLHMVNKHKILILISILSSSIYGISDELHQYFVPFRQADVMDALANILGSITGVLLYQFLFGKHAIDELKIH